MPEVAQNTQHDFWRPPVSQAGTAMVEACDSCGTEFMVGAGFCHVCGTARQAQVSATVARDWTQYLEFQNIKQGLGLSTGSLIAFLTGIGCLLAVVAVGVIYSMQTFADFQAVQLYRMQWLLAAVAAFVAGILLKKAQ
jgi:hypothetical protein